MGEVIKESDSQKEKNQEIVPVEIDSDNSEGDNTKNNIRVLPNNSIFSDLTLDLKLMIKTLGRLMSSANSLKKTFSGATILGVPIYTLGGDKLRIRDNGYDLTPEIYKALSFTGYPRKTMKNENDILMMKNILNDLGYTGIGDRDSRRKIFFKKLFRN